MTCPCCKQEGYIDDGFKQVTLMTDWGYEYFNQCCQCGVIFDDPTPKASPAEKGGG